MRATKAKTNSTKEPSVGLEQGELRSVLGYIGLSRLVSRSLFQRLVSDPLQINRPEFNVLLLLRKNGTLTAKQLCEATMMPKSNMSSLVNRLKLRSFVEQVDSTANHRMQPLRLTAEGKRIANQAAAINPQIEEQLTRHLTEHERHSLIHLLEKVIASANLQR